MIVFKTFLKVIRSYRIPILLYTAILVGFGAINIQTSDQTNQFVATKPNIYIINHDDEVGITADFISYLEDHATIADLKNEDQALQDALFYRDVNYIVEIPNGFRKDFLASKEPQLNIQSTGDYKASLAEMMVKRYMKTAVLYEQTYDDETKIIDGIASTLKKEAPITVTSTLDTKGLMKAKFFYNFMNYSLLAGCVYVICLALSSFRQEKIKNRTMISSVHYRAYNRQLLLANGVFALVLWGIYVALSMLLIGKIMYSMHGAIFVLNSFVFMVCALSIGFLIANITNNKGAINGILNVIALGSSFLCGAFVPMEWLPDVVLKLAHILPSYWYIKSNEMIYTLEQINMNTLEPVLWNMGVICLFTIGFLMVSNLIVYKKRKIQE